MKNTAKKIGIITTIAIVGVLILATLIMTIVPYSFKLDIANPDSIVVYHHNGSQSASGTFDPSVSAQKGIYNNILDKFDASFEQSALSVLFNGDLGKEATLKASTTTVNVKSATYLKFVYDENQEYTYNGQKYSYNQIIFAISSTADEFESVTAFIVKVGGSENYSQHRYTLDANYSALVDYLAEIRDSWLTVGA